MPKQLGKHNWYICCHIWTGPTSNAMLLVYEQTFVCRVDVQLKSFISIDFIFIFIFILYYIYIYIYINIYILYSLTFNEGFITLIISASAIFLLRVLFL